MSLTQPLFWDDNDLVLPQHFQLRDQNCQSLLSPFYRYRFPHHWGVGSLSLDAEALTGGTVLLKAGSFLFPGGSYAVLHENAVVQGRSLPDAWGEAGQPLTVFIGLKRCHRFRVDVTPVAGLDTIGAADTRFVTRMNPEEVPDLHAGGPHGEVRRQHYLLRVFWDQEVDKLGDYHLIPILQLERSGQTVRRVASFVPPVLSLNESCHLTEIIADIRETLALRSRGLESYKSRRRASDALLEVQELCTELVLSSLKRCLPMLFRATEAGQMHPSTVYLGLLQLIGELSTFAESGSCVRAGERLAAFRQYRHAELGVCFAWARDRILEILDEVTAGPDYVVPLNREGTFYCAELRPALFQGNNRYYLALSTRTDRRSLVLALETEAKVSTRQHLPVLAAKALPGVELTYIPAPPRELPQTSDTLYLALDHLSEPWSRIVRERNLALYWGAAPPDLHLELMVLSRSSG